MNVNQGIIAKNDIINQLKESEEKFRILVEHSPSVIILIQQDNIIYANPMAVELMGYSIDELYQMKWWDLVHSDMRDLIKNRGLNRQEGKEEIERYELKMEDKSGEVHWLDLSACRVIHKGQTAILSNAYNITDRKKAEYRLERLIHLKDSILEINQFIVGIDDIQVLYDLILAKALETIDLAYVGSILKLTKDDYLVVAAQKGYDPEKMVEFNIPLKESFLCLKGKGKFEETIIINHVQKLPGVKALDMTSDQKDWFIGSTISAPIKINGKLYGMVNIDSEHINIFTEEDREILDTFRDQIEIALTKHLLYEEKINLSRCDKLTNIYNRRYFEKLFEQYFVKVKEYKEKFSLVIFDLNGLKIVNDNYGHLVGDEYLKKFATTLNNNLRDSDLFARYGGDEFVAVLYNTESENVILKMEEIVVKLNHSPLSFEEKEIICSFSYGIANYPDDAQDYKDLVKIADMRMYKYKAKVKSNKT